MRRLVVNLDDELDLWMQSQINQNETARKALALYKGDITTDTVEGMRAAFLKLLNQQQELEQRLIELYELVEKIVSAIEELRH